MTKEPARQSADDAPLVALLASLPGVADRLQAPRTPAGDPLDEVAAEDLLELLAQLCRMRTVVEDQQDRVLAACHRHGVSLRVLAATVGLNSPEAVRKRLAKTRGRIQDDEASADS